MVKGLIRRSFVVGSLAAAALCSLAGVRSYWARDAAQWAVRGWGFTIDSADGRVRLGLLRASSDVPSVMARGEAIDGLSEPYGHVQWKWDPLRMAAGHAGFDLRDEPVAGIVWASGPWWIVVGLAGLPALRMLLPAAWAAARERRRRRAGRCVACGYDLRSSGERCPECGRDVGEPAAHPWPWLTRGRHRLALLLLTTCVAALLVAEPASRAARREAAARRAAAAAFTDSRGWRMASQLQEARELLGRLKRESQEQAARFAVRRAREAEKTGHHLVARNLYTNALAVAATRAEAIEGLTRCEAALAARPEGERFALAAGADAADAPGERWARQRIQRARQLIAEGSLVEARRLRLDVMEYVYAAEAGKADLSDSGRRALRMLLWELEHPEAEAHFQRR